MPDKTPNSFDYALASVSYVSKKRNIHTRNYKTNPLLKASKKKTQRGILQGRKKKQSSDNPIIA